MDKDKLDGILASHAKWLTNEYDGKRADLSSADLSSADLRSADLSSANLSSADLSGANLSSADLRSANLSSADLRSANLSSANLSSADLRSADLRSANLRSADLSGAKYFQIIRAISTPLLFLLDQPGNIHAYKLVNENNEGPYNGGIEYKIGGEYSVDECNENINEQCGAGINLCTLDWALHNYRDGYKVLIAEFTAEDIVCIPTATDGKFRVKRCKIVGEKDVSGYFNENGE